MNEAATPPANPDASPAPTVTLAAEVWRAVSSYEGYYEVSDIGRVRRVKSYRNTAKAGGIMALYDAPDYLSVMLHRPGIRGRKFRVHSLVATAFLGARPEGQQINHIDGDKLNNCSRNLEYVTPHENMSHAHRLGLLKIPSGNNAAFRKYPELVRRGSQVPQAKLDEPKVLQIRALLAAKVPQAEIARRYGIHSSCIWRISKGRAWAHVA